VKKIAPRYGVAAPVFFKYYYISTDINTLHNYFDIDIVLKTVEAIQKG